MPSFNHVVLMGHLTRDPELKYTDEGTAVCELGLACNRRWTKKNGEKAESVIYVDVTAWNRMGETCAQYLLKGRGVLVSGYLAQDQWEDKETRKKRSKLRVVANNVTFLSNGSNGDPSSSEEAPAEPDWI